MTIKFYTSPKDFIPPKQIYGYAPAPDPTTGASKGTPSDAKCVTEILVGGDQNKEIRVGQSLNLIS